jgi:hypothetical protein
MVKSVKMIYYLNIIKKWIIRRECPKSVISGYGKPSTTLWDSA